MVPRAQQYQHIDLKNVCDEMFGNDVHLDKRSPSLLCETDGASLMSSMPATPPHGVLGDSFELITPSKNIIFDKKDFSTPETTPINATYRMCRQKKQNGIATRSVSSFGGDYYQLDRQTLDRLTEIEIHLSSLSAHGVVARQSTDNCETPLVCSTDTDKNLSQLKWRLLFSIIAISLSTIRIQLGNGIRLRLSQVALSLSLACIIARPHSLQKAASSLSSALLFVFMTLDTFPAKLPLAISLTSFISILEEV